MLTFVLFGVRLLVRALPLKICFLLGEAIGFLLWMILPGYRRLVGRNLRIAFSSFNSPTTSGAPSAPNSEEKVYKSDAEIRELIRKSFTTLGGNLISSLKMPMMSEKSLRQVFSIEGKEIWDTYLARQKERGTVVALSHFGNWELTAQLTTFIPDRPSGTIYQAIKNKALNRLVNEDRAQRGVKTFDRRRQLRAATAFLRQGGILGLLIDQHAGDRGVWIPFLGKLASTSPLAASLAQKTNADLLFATIRTVGRARWELTLAPPFPTEGRSLAAITYDLGEALAKEIKRSPADWFWFHNRWKLPFPSFLLQKTKRGIEIPSTFPIERLHPWRLLVRSPNWLGDACMAIPALRAIKQGRPDLHLTLLSPAKLTPLWEYYQQEGLVDQVIPIAPGSPPWQVARDLIKEAPSPEEPPFDIALLLPNSWRSALEIWLAKIPRKIGRAPKADLKGGLKSWTSRQWLLNHTLPPSSKKKKDGSWQHQAQEYLKIAEALGAIIPDRVQQTASNIPITNSELPNNHLPKQLCRKNPDHWQVGIIPGAEFGPAKRWPLDSFSQAIFLITKQHRVAWKLLGVTSEQPLGETLLQLLDQRWATDTKASKQHRLAKISQLPKSEESSEDSQKTIFKTSTHPLMIENLIGKTSLQELILQIKELDLIISNDTGTMHLASLLGTPVIALFGSTEPAATGPKGEHDQVLRHPVECSPCFLRNCPIDFRCMQKLTPQEVVKAFEKLITSLYSPPLHNRTTFNNR